MSNDLISSKQALEKARQAYKRGDKSTARYWTQKAVTESPDNESAWLWLASPSEPRASVAYLNKALEINPDSTRARSGMHWAVQRLRETASPPIPMRDIVEESIPPLIPITTHFAFLASNSLTKKSEILSKTFPLSIA